MNIDCTTVGIPTQIHSCFGFCDLFISLNKSLVSCSGREAAEWVRLDWRGSWSDQWDWGLREAADHLISRLLLLLCNPSQPGHAGGCQLHSASLSTRLLYCCSSTWLCALGRVRMDYCNCLKKLFFIDAWKGKFVVIRQNVRRETVYETPHSLLDNISLGYRQVFLAQPSISLSSLHFFPPTWEVFVQLSYFNITLSRQSLFAGFWSPPLCQAGKVEREARKWSRPQWKRKLMRRRKKSYLYHRPFSLCFYSFVI